MGINTGFVALLLLLAAVYYPVLPELIGVWLSDSNNSHGMLVPLISGYLIYEKREVIASYLSGEEHQRTGFWFTTAGLFMFAASLALYLLFYIGHIAFIMRVTLVLSVIALVWYCFGREVLKTIGFPLVFLFFMIPVPISFTDRITLPLKTMATNMAVPLIAMFDIPVLQEGNVIHLASCSLEVAEACSGIRSIFSMLMLGTLFASFINGNIVRKIVLVLAAPIIAVVANILRVSGTGIVASFYGERAARGYVHDLSGYLVFMFGLLVLFLLYRFLDEKHKERL